MEEAKGPTWVEKLSFTKLVPGAKKVGGCCFRQAKEDAQVL